MGGNSGSKEGSDREKGREGEEKGKKVGDMYKESSYQVETRIKKK